MVQLVRRDKDIQTNVVLTLSHEDILEAIKIYAKNLLKEEGKAIEFGFLKSTTSEEVSVIRMVLEENGEILTKLSVAVTLSHSLPKREYPLPSTENVMEATPLEIEADHETKEQSLDPYGDY